MAKDYSKLSKEELLKTIEKLESRKKYGLIWDEERTKEKFEQDAENAYPVLKEVKGRAIETDPEKPVNLLIEGDNYHALSVLQYTHQRKVDVIYIDPPYNTGSRDWKYNNNFVDDNDTWRHSKWLSFMSKRLRLAKNLLSEKGVLICTIDHNEQEPLGLLLKELFADREITCITIVHNPAGIQGDNFSYTHEFAYFIYPKPGRYIGLQTREVDNEDIRNFRDVTGDESLRTAGANCFYPVLVKNGKIVGFGEVCKDSYHPRSVNLKRRDGVIEVYPIDPQGIERKWRFARHTVESIRDELQAILLKRRGVWDIKRTKNRFNYKTVWTDSKYSANNYGTQLLNQIIERGSFAYPKSLYAVIDCITAAANGNKNAVVLDFFAGSGTTGHAVLQLNKKDGGNRQFILSTNNENNIATDICYPRIEKVIKGYKKNGNGEKVAGFGGNLRYFKTAFVKKSINRDEIKVRITNECTEMLSVREGIYDLKKETTQFRTFTQGQRIMGVYYALDRSGLSALKKEFDRFTGDKILYCFTLDPLGLDQHEFDYWQNIRLEPIPQPILDIYQEIHELGT
ncbi:MAG: DNA methyltransferase [Patescibacteria group bacterium]